MEERVLYFFPTQITYGVVDVSKLKKNLEKEQISRLQIMKISEVTLLLRQTCVLKICFKKVSVTCMAVYIVGHDYSQIKENISLF